MHNDDLEGGRRCSQTAKQLIGGFNDTPMTVYLNLIIELLNREEGLLSRLQWIGLRDQSARSPTIPLVTYKEI